MAKLNVEILKKNLQNLIIDDNFNLRFNNSLITVGNNIQPIEQGLSIEQGLYTFTNQTYIVHGADILRNEILTNQQELNQEYINQNRMEENDYDYTTTSYYNVRPNYNLNA